VVALPTWQGLLVVVGCSLLLAVLIQFGGDALIRRLTRRISSDVDAVIFRSVHPPLYVTVVLVGAFVAVKLLEVATDWTDLLRAGLLTLLVLMWMNALIRMGRRVSNEATEDERFDNQVVPIFQNVWTAVVLGGGIYLVLTVWNIDVTPLLASAGVLGIVLGLAARDTIANFFGSLALYADRTYAIGDFVLLDSGERGRVEDVSIRSTDIRTRSDTIITVPNSQLNTATIINESTPERERRLRVSLGVAYGSDLEYVEDVLLDVARDER
jgi:MscS family membrane protein